jgi:pyruvate-ferredoxin/flavodoxin oxidoreductase
MSKKIISVDGNTAAGYIGYMMSELAGIYPITPSSPMAEYADELNAAGKKNIFGHLTKIVEMQSEAGAAGTVHGSLVAGALTTTFTASQGLLLMIPNMYKIAGELMPAVFHVSARTLASHALNIFGDHSDVMACRQTGFLMLASNNVQEVMDMAFISHIATLRASLPILHFFDGFRTSHEINKIENIDEELMKKMLPIKEIEEFKKRAHNPLNPKQTGTAQNPDIFFQNREACNKYYDRSYDIVEKVMDEFATHTGRQYKPFMYEGSPEAKFVVIAMCSANDTISEVVKYLVAKNKKVGVLKVHLYRPFDTQAFSKALPSTVKKIAVLDRTKEPGSVGEPLYEDVVTALKEVGRSKILVTGGRYGLGGKDFTPEDALAVFDNLKMFSKQHFTTSINDDVTRISLTPGKLKNFNTNIYEMKFFGLGSDGTVSANKSSIKIVGDLTNKFVQGYFEYDSKKSGSLTTSHLRISDDKFNSPYLVKNADFIAVHNYAFIHQYDILDGIKKNGKVLLNTSMSEEQLAKDLPENFKEHLKKSKAQLYIIPAFDVARNAGLGNRINVIMQACFFKIANIIPYDVAEKSMKDFATKAYGKKGEAILTANMRAIEAATTDLKEVNTKKIIRTKSQSLITNLKMSEYYKNFVHKINARHGDKMSVSEFDPSGTVPTGTTQYEKRGIGLNVPVWVPENCIQCGQCVLVCPHAVIRSFLLSDADAQKANSVGIVSKPALGTQGASFIIQASP